MMKKIAVLGSADSIGTWTLEAVRYSKDIQVIALAAGGNVKLMEEQIHGSKPGLTYLWSREKVKELQAAVADLDVKVASSMERLMEAATSPKADLVVTAVVGMIGIRPAITVVEADEDIVLANREALVTTGHITIPLTREKGVKLLPVDSEHSAILQCLQGAADNPLHKILLTASDGPLQGFAREQLKQVRPKNALKHPSWSMGRKITIDSSTMVNKRLEAMEAHWLFGMETGQARVVAQPVSIIHSMAESEDEAVMARLDTPDMKLPIQCALYYPECRFLPGDRLDFEKLTKIFFEMPGMETSRGLKLVYEAGRRGGTLPTVFNAADETAVAMLLERKVNYLTIVDMIEGVMKYHYVKPSLDMAQILKAEWETCDYLSSKQN